MYGNRGLGSMDAAIMATNAINIQANTDLAILVNEVARLMAVKGYAVTMAKTAGAKSGMYQLTDEYRAYVNNVPQYAGYEYLLNVSDLNRSAASLAEAILDSFEWKAMFSGKAIQYPEQMQQTQQTIQQTIQQSVIQGSGKQTVHEVPEIGPGGGGAVVATNTNTGTGSSTSIDTSSDVTSVANGTVGTKDLTYYKELLQSDDIIPNVPNWMILAGAAGLLLMINKGKF